MSATIKRRLQALISGQGLLKNISWMIAAEGVARASRLVTLLVLGIYMSPTQYGTIMLAIVCHELMRVFTRVGSGAKLIQCRQDELPDLAGNAATLQWLLCLGVTVAQILSAETIANYYNNPELAPLLRFMALSNLLYPLVAIRVFLVQRSNNLRYFAQASAASVIVENLCTAFFVVAGMGVMSVALAKLCSAACWVALFLRARVASFSPQFSLCHMQQLTGFASKVLTSELLKTLRAQVDSLFAARLLSPEMFGVYSFAKSAGIGLSQSLSAGYLSSLYPYLCEKLQRGSLENSLRKIYLITAGIAAIFLLQAALAPVYLELLFGQRWEDATLLVSILCLSAIPALFIDTSSTICRAQNNTNQEVLLMLFCVTTLAMALFIVQPSTAIECAYLTTFISLTWPSALFLKYKLTSFAQSKAVKSYP